MRRETKLALVLVVTGALVARRAVAQSETINACAANAGGRLRMLAAGAACKRSEHAVSWAVAGPQGPKGEPGPAGGAGPPSFPANGGLS